MRIDPHAITHAMNVAKKIAAQVDPGFAKTPMPHPGQGIPLMHASGGAVSSLGIHGHDQNGDHMVHDAGITTPESPLTLAYQRQALMDGVRPAMLYPANGHPAPEPPEGAHAVMTRDGVFHYNPNMTSAEHIHAASRAGRLNEVLGLGPYSKDDIAKRMMQGEKLMNIVVRDANDHEVVSVAGTPYTAHEQAQHLARHMPEGGSIGMEPVEHILQQRHGRPEGQNKEVVRSAMQDPAIQHALMAAHTEHFRRGGIASLKGAKAPRAPKALKTGSLRGPRRSSVSTSGDAAAINLQPSLKMPLA
jgi:hypothetical protein